MSENEPTPLAELALTLRHDVGKYITRAARNLPPGDAPPVLLDMLVADLYRTDGERSALAVYDARVAAAGVDAGLVPPAIRAELEALMDLEEGVRAHDASAVARACRVALAVDDACRAFVHAQGRGS
jgi:hypothetical protein